MTADDMSDPRPRSRAEELLARSTWDLPVSRRLRTKEALMQQIDHDAAPTTPTTPPSAARRRRFPRPALLVPLASMALAGTLVVTLSGHGHDSAPPAAGSTVDTGHRDASVTLDRIAAAAMTTDTTDVDRDQFVYVRTLLRANKGTFGGPVHLGALHGEEIWTSQNPAPVTRTGWLRETGKDAVMPDEIIPIESTASVPVGFDRPTYAFLASLPTEPGALLRLLYARTEVADGRSKDQAVFERIGDLLGTTIMPPANAAALYKAVERIPGVIDVPDAVDAAGRHGLGITRRDTASTTRSEWIFDRHTLTYLGSRAYFTRNRATGIEHDTLYGTDAVMERGVVTHHGDKPARGDG